MNTYKTIVWWQYTFIFDEVQWNVAIMMIVAFSLLLFQPRLCSSSPYFVTLGARQVTSCPLYSFGRSFLLLRSSLFFLLFLLLLALSLSRRLVRGSNNDNNSKMKTNELHLFVFVFGPSFVFVLLSLAPSQSNRVCLFSAWKKRTSREERKKRNQKMPDVMMSLQSCRA